MNKLKELRLIVKMNERLGVETEQSVFDQIIAEEQKEKKQIALQEERKAVFKSTFADLSGQISKLMAEEKQKSAEEQALLDRFATVLAKIDDIKANAVSDEPQVTIAEDADQGQQVEDVLEGIVEIPEVIEEAILAPIEEPSLAKEAAKKIKKKGQPPSMFVQPAPEVTGRDLKDIQQKLKLLEGWVGKISMTGPGGGAVWLRDLDDVARSSVLGATDGQVLTYNESIKKWTAQDPTGGGPGGYVLPTASTTTKGGVKIDGTTITISNQVISANTTVDWLHVPSSIIPNTSLTYSLGNNTNRWESIWVGGNSVTFADQTTGFPDQKLTLANGIFYIAIANTTQQSNGGLRVGNFLLQNNYIQLTNTEATFYIGATLGTGNLVINRPIVVNSYDTGNQTFGVTREGLVTINTPATLLTSQAALTIVGSSTGDIQPRNFSGSLIQAVAQDGQPARIGFDAYGAGAYASVAGRAARGTAASPLPTLSGDTLLRLTAQGWAAGSNTYVGSIVRINLNAAEDFYTANTGTKITFQTTPVGSNTLITTATIDSTGINTNNATLVSITANNAKGSAGQVLASNGTGVYWTNATASQIQTDWNQSNTLAIDFIKNKPTIPTTIDSLTDVTITGPLNNQVLTYNTALSQWINQNGTSNNFTTGYFGAFYYNGANVALSNTTNAYVVPITASYDGTNGVTVGSNNDIVFAHSGTYHIEYSNQYENNGNSDDDVNVWIRINGTDQTNTNSRFSVNRKNTGQDPGSLIAVTPFMVTVNAGDRVQVMHSSEGGHVKLVSYAAGTTPTVPGTPAVIVNVEQVSGIVIPDNISGTANNALYLSGIAANQYAYANGVASLTSNNISFVGAISAVNVNSNTLTLTYAGATPTGYPLIVNASNTQGGTGYADFLKVTNKTAGATANTKSFRLNSVGGIEIINSAYSATIFSLSDTGALNVPGPITVGGKQAVNGPAFSAYANNTLQTIPTDVQTKVLFQVEEFDTNNNYASSRFTPTVEGYYQLNAEVRLDGASGTGEIMIILYKNGTEYKRGINQRGAQIATNFWAMQVSSLVYANGTGDYFEIYVQQGSGGNVTVTAVNNSAITWFNGCMLRGA